MRDFKGMKRQRGRNRGPGGGSGGGNNSGGKQQHNANRAFDSNGPEGIKVRGAAQGVFEKYQQLARDAATGGDRVLAENYLQHAEHYYRVLRAVQPQRPASEIMVRDAFSSGYDIDFEAEPEFVAEAPTEAEAESGQTEGESPREERQRDDRPREDRPRYNNNDRQRDERPRDDRPREDRPRYNNNDRPREDRQRDDRPREDRPRDDRPRYNNNDRPRDERPRDERPREDRPREDRPRDDRPREERSPRYERTERAAEPAPIADTQPIAQPVARDSARLRGQDGAVSEAPAFLSRGAAPAAEPAAATSDEAPKKRGRPRKAAAPAEDA